MSVRSSPFSDIFLADRQISVRLGQSFWCRGPSLSTKFTARDFSTLQPTKEGEEDYASVLQSTVELTQIMHNAHDILYSSRSRTLALVLAGDYNRYLDDFQKAATVWQLAWDNLAVAPRIKNTLSLMYEYLSLYVNAFSFQAVLTRESSRQRTRARGEMITGEKPHPAPFSGGIMSSPDGRYVFDALTAALKILRIMVEMHPSKELRYLPSRYYLYVFSPCPKPIMANDLLTVPPDMPSTRPSFYTKSSWLGPIQPKRSSKKLRSWYSGSQGYWKKLLPVTRMLVAATAGCSESYGCGIKTRRQLKERRA